MTALAEPRVLVEWWIQPEERVMIDQKAGAMNWKLAMFRSYSYFQGRDDVG